MGGTAGWIAITSRRHAQLHTLPDIEIRHGINVYALLYALVKMACGACNRYNPHRTNHI